MAKRTIRSMHPQAQPVFTKILEMAQGVCNKYNKKKGTSYYPKYISTLRTFAEQARLYAKGRSKPGSIVTWVKYSWHNFGLAGDMGIFAKNKYGLEYYVNGSRDDYGQALNLYSLIGKEYNRLKEGEGMFKDVVWGGDFPKYFTGSRWVDKPHWEYHPGYAVNGGLSKAIKFKNNPFGINIRSSSYSGFPINPILGGDTNIIITGSLWEQLNEIIGEGGKMHHVRLKNINLIKELEANNNEMSSLRSDSINITNKINAGTTFN